MWHRIVYVTTLDETDGTLIFVANTKAITKEMVWPYSYDVKKVMIPESVQYIRGQTFYYCRHLSSIKIPDGVTIIGGSAFEGCENLNSVTISASDRSIGEYAFSGCKSLESIKIPKCKPALSCKTQLYRQKLSMIFHES